MPTFKQITQYVIADELLNEEIQTRFTNIVPKRLQENLDTIYEQENVFVPGRVTRLAKNMTSRYSLLYLNDCFKHHRSDNEFL